MSEAFAVQRSDDIWSFYELSDVEWEVALHYTSDLQKNNNLVMTEKPRAFKI